MPVNNNLDPVELPMPLRFNEEPKTEFVNDIENLKVTLVNAPTLNELRNTLVPFVLATWADKPLDPDTMSDEEKDAVLLEIFSGKALPTALELVGCTYLLEGLSFQDVTHIIRHRMGSFSAQCTGDRWLSHHNAVVPEAIENSPEFIERYKNVVKATKQLYCDMVNSKKISIMDARLILPKCIDTFYYMRMNLGDTIRFINQRADVAIQTKSDNVIAYKMALELCKQYPLLAKVLDPISTKSDFFIKMARTGKATNLYFPEAKNDVFEFNEKDFIYQCTRDEMNGTCPPEGLSKWQKFVVEMKDKFAALKGN